MNPKEAAAALEAEIAGIIVELEIAKAEQAELISKVAGLEESMKDMWDVIERDFAPIFGLRGVYPEIPERWYPIILRMLQRIKGQLTPIQFQCLRISQVKEKWGRLDVSWFADHDEVDGADQDDGDTAWIVAMKINDAAEEEVDRLETIRKNLM